MNLDLVTYEKVSELVREGHQVMVFVHARKETVKAAVALRETASKDGVLHEFSCEEHPSFGHFRREIGASRNKEMKQLFDDGFGIHHAGMLRTDRTMMERMFNARAIKVCTTCSVLRPLIRARFCAALRRLRGESIYQPTRVSTFVCKYGPGSLLLCTLSYYQRHSSIR
jgi:hypothetical protein